MTDDLEPLDAGYICFGANPFIGYILVGVGAIACSLTKYDILDKLTTGDRLVEASGLMESLIIATILPGPMTGGIFVD